MQSAEDGATNCAVIARLCPITEFAAITATFLSELKLGQF